MRLAECDFAQVEERPRVLDLVLELAVLGAADAPNQLIAISVVVQQDDTALRLEDLEEHCADQIKEVQLYVSSQISGDR